MNGWLTALSVFVFIILLLFSRGGRDTRILAQSLWSLITIVAFLVIAIMAVVKGNWRGLGTAFAWLAGILTATGVIPGLIIQYWGFWRKGSPLNSTPPPSSSAPVNVDFLSQGGIVEKPKPDFVQKILTCPKCGRELRKRNGRFGLFLGCAGYPACKSTQSLR